MSRGALLPLLLVSIIAASFLHAIALPVPTGSEASGRLRVVVLSADAMRFDHMIELAGKGVLGNISRLLQGVYAETIVTYPSATAVSHAAISTGAPPSVNGVTGNSIHLPGTTVTTTVSGFNGSYMVAEPIWVTADRQGLKSIVVSFPQSTPPAWSVSSALLFNIYDASAAFTYSILYTTNTSVPKAQYISFTDASGWSNVDKVFGSVASAKESTIKVGDTTWYLYLADINGDGLYDKLAVAPEKDLSKAYTILGEGEWSKPINTTVTYKGVNYTIAPLLKALRLNPLGDFRLYRGTTRPFEAPWFNNATVAWDVWNNVITRTGTFTDGDYYGLTNGWFDEETYMETVYFTNKLFMEWTIYMMKNYDWDLLMTYTSVIDNVYHQFLGLTDPSMPYYDPSKADYYWSLIERTYRMVDEFVGAILNNVNTSNTVVILVSDHGQAPVSKTIYINGILYNNGFIGVDSQLRVNVSATKAYSTYSGHIFVNLAGREINGIVQPGEYDSVVNSIIELLRSYKDPDTGQPVFDIVVRRSDASVIGLDSERTGDIVFSVKPGYTVSTSLSISTQTMRATEIAPAVPLKTVTGDHGPILPQYPELHAVFAALGPGITGGYLGTASTLHIAPTIARLLGIQPPANSSATPLFIVHEVTSTVTETTTVPTTITSTITIKTTVTETQSTTIKETITLTITETTTKTETVTSTTTLTETTPVTVREIDIGTTAVVGIVLLVVGIGVGVMASKRH